MRQLFDFSILFNYWDLYVKGLGSTVAASLLALVGSFILGVWIAVFRIAPIRMLNWIGTAYVEFFRNIPLLLIVFVFFYGSHTFGLTLNGFVSGTIGLSIYTSSYIAEAVRAGIQSIPRGQMEAARSSGLTYKQAMQHVILPQAMRIVIPPITNQFLNLIKNSSVLGVVAGMDLMYFGDDISLQTNATFATYIFVGLFYLLLTVPVSYASGILERKLARN